MSIVHVFVVNKGEKMRNTNFEKIFVPGIIDYDSHFVEAFKARINKINGINNSDIYVLIALCQISSIEKLKFQTGVYSDGPVHDYWKIHMKDSIYYTFQYETGSAIAELWKRYFREGRWNMEEDIKLKKTKQKKELQ